MRNGRKVKSVGPASLDEINVMLERKKFNAEFLIVAHGLNGALSYLRKIGCSESAVREFELAHYVESPAPAPTPSLTAVESVENVASAPEIAAEESMVSGGAEAQPPPRRRRRSETTS